MSALEKKEIKTIQTESKKAKLPKVFDALTISIRTLNVSDSMDKDSFCDLKTNHENDYLLYKLFFVVVYKSLFLGELFEKSGILKPYSATIHSPFI